MVEGYTDVISMHQCGIENVVANSGTALSVFQIKLLRRFTQNVVLLYDGDEAGIHAAMRGTDMLLAEGMNIKVLLLPDGDDPDSFARKHTAADFRAYIADHQTDFMEFKTRLLLKDVSDPIKRSEAISSIVKSISVIPDQIVRATYIKDCSLRIAIPEQTLISEMNKFIRRDREDKARQDERDASRREQQISTAPPRVVGAPPANQITDQLEQLLVQMVIRHGGDTAFRDMEGDDGNRYDISVAEYIYYDLEDDGVKLENALYQQILEEAVAEVQAGNTDVRTFFMKHPDVKVNSLAAQLGEDTYVLTESMQVRTNDEALRSQVMHLLLEYRMNILKRRIDSLIPQLLHSSDDEEKNRLREELRQLQEMRQAMAKRAGKSIMV